MRFLEWLRSTGKILHGDNSLWSMMKKSSVSRMQRFMYSQILCYVLERWIRTQQQILLGNGSWIGSKIQHSTELWTRLTENWWNSSGILSKDSLHCSSSKKSKISWTKWATQEQFQGRMIFMSMFSDIIWGIKDNAKECIANSTHVSFFCNKISSRTLVIPRTWIRNKVVARVTGSPWHATNRRRRTRKGPEPACVQTLMFRGGTRRGEKDELTSCRGTVQSAWQYLQWVAKEGELGCPKRVSGRHVVWGRQSSLILEVRPGNRQGWWKRSISRWNGRQLTLDKTVGSRVWWHTQGSSGRPASHLEWRSSSKTAPGSLSTGSTAGRTPPHGDGSMYSQANVRAVKVLRLVRDRGHWKCDAGSGWPVGRAALTAHFGWKGDRPGVRLESRSGEPVRSPKITSGCSICLYPGQHGRCSKITEKIPKSEIPDIWIRLPRHKWPKSWSSVEDPVVRLEQNLNVHPSAGLLWERQ